MKSYLTKVILLLFLCSCKQSVTEGATITNSPNYHSIKTIRYATKMEEGKVIRDSITQFFIDEYDEENQDILSTYYNPKGEVLAIFENSFVNNLKAGNTFKGADGTIYSKNKIYYDDQGKEIKSESYNATDELTSSTERVWENDYKTKTVTNINLEGRRYLYAIYNYDEKDRETQLDEFEVDGSMIAIVKSKYVKEDCYGNWLEKQIFINDTLRTIESRQISYQPMVSNSKKVKEIIYEMYSTKIERDKAVRDTLQFMQSDAFHESGKEKAHTEYLSDRSLNWEDVYEYNDAGIKTGSKFYTKGKQTAYYTYDLDEYNRRRYYEGFDVNTDTSLYHVAFRYGADHHLKQSGYLNKEGKFICDNEYLYDRPVNTPSKESDAIELRYTYIARNGTRYPIHYQYTKYNEEGKWIERECLFKDGTVRTIQTRKFVYY